MPAEFVTKINLYDNHYNTRQDVLDINQKIELPTVLQVDTQAIAGGINTYLLRSRIYSSSGSVEAQYSCYVPQPTEMAVSLYSLLHPVLTGVPVQFITGFGSVPTWHMYSTQPGHSILAGLDTLVNTGHDPWGTTSGDAEPPCRCDIRALMSSGHVAGCGWLTWKRSRR